MGRNRRIGLAVPLGLVLLALLPTTVSAASANETISGAETSYPTACGPAGSNDSQSPFAGEAMGTIRGTWSAAICHTPVSTAAGATIVPGGYFRLRGFTSQWIYVMSSGSFVSGVISAGRETDYFGRCTQVFDVKDVVLTNGNLPSATLVHYGLLEGGSCHIFSATIAGAGVLNY
jgi:hypothetical protein